MRALIFACFVFAAPAGADDDPRAAFAAEAEAALTRLDAGADPAAEALAFARHAAVASARNADSGGPADLSCIYAGMAEDAGERAEALESGADAAADLRALMHDAVLVSRPSTDAHVDDAPMSCPAVKAAARPYLSVKP